MPKMPANGFCRGRSSVKMATTEGACFSTAATTGVRRSDVPAADRGGLSGMGDGAAGGATGPGAAGSGRAGTAKDHARQQPSGSGKQSGKYRQTKSDAHGDEKL